LTLTIYNNICLVRDIREVDMPSGLVDLVFQDVSPKIVPNTILFICRDTKVLEQSFRNEPVTPKNILRNFIGKKVILATTNPKTGEDEYRPAVLLSDKHGIVLRVGNHIETDIRGRLIYPDLPEQLQNSPSLYFQLESMSSGKRTAELDYLTKGIHWRADYTGILRKDDSLLDLRTWISITNRSGIIFEHASVQLVAGDVNISKMSSPGTAYRALSSGNAGASTGKASEKLFEYHLYTVNRPVTIRPNGLKQVSLSYTENIPCKKELVIEGSNYSFSRKMGPKPEKIKAKVFLLFKNTKDSGLGFPLPRGTMRLFKADSNNRLQFIGDNVIDHVAEGETVRLKLGRSFDVTGIRRQTTFRKIPGNAKYRYGFESSYEIALHNAKGVPVTVKVAEPLSGDWNIIQENFPHEKPKSDIAVWQIRVPAKDKKILKYTARVVY